MFTVFMRRIRSPKYGENIFDRYFHTWSNAQSEMDKEVNEYVQIGARIVFEIDRLNAEKGFYEYQKDLEWDTEDGTYKITFALIDAYFRD